MQMKDLLMKMPRVVMLLCIVFIGVGQVEAQDEIANPINAASLFSGSYMRVIPEASYAKSNLQGEKLTEFTPECLFDESSDMWCSLEEAPFPFVFEIEFVESFIIHGLQFDTNCEDYEGISAKEVKVEIATSATDPEWQEFNTYKLKANRVNSYPIEPTEIRVVRLTILSNHGHPNFTELAEFRALGKPKMGAINPIHVGGKWTSDWGNVFFDQQGTVVNGKYDWHDGFVRYGNVSRNQLSYSWDEPEYDLQGNMIMYLNQEGTRLTGIWCLRNDWSDFGFWILERTKKTPYKPLKKQKTLIASIRDEVVEDMKAEFTKYKRLNLYGISFEPGSSEISMESKETLGHFGQILLEEPNIKVRIQGHTDNIGSEIGNEKLSQQWANAVANFFKANHGIEDRRVRTEGKGESEPIAKNSTEIGRSANRRIEILWVQ